MASQMIVAGPMVVLYVLSIAIAWVFGKEISNDRFGGRRVEGAHRHVDLHVSAIFRRRCHCLDHILRLDFQHFLRPAIPQFHNPVLQSLGADRQPQRHAEQIGVLELDARAQPFAIVVKHFEARAPPDRASI